MNQFQNTEKTKQRKGLKIDDDIHLPLPSLLRELHVIGPLFVYPQP